MKAPYWSKPASLADIITASVAITGEEGLYRAKGGSGKRKDIRNVSIASCPIQQDIPFCELDMLDKQLLEWI